MEKYFNNFLYNLSKILLKQSLLKRRIILIVIDAILIFISFIFSSLLVNYDLRNEQISSNIFLFICLIIIEIITYAFTKQYKPLARYSGTETLYNIGIRNIFTTFLIFNILALKSINNLGINFFIILWLLKTFLIMISRVTIKDIISQYHLINYKNRKNVCIYGAGGAGVQLASALRMNGRHSVVYFLDDDKQLWNRTIDNISVLPPSSIDKLKIQIDEVFLAIPSISKSRRAEIINFLKDKKISVRKVPSINDLTSGKSKIDSLRPIDIEDLLGRDTVCPDPNLLAGQITNSSILITGAGGSIGSELCRQIIKLKPKKIILFERSEISLYKINQELNIPEFIDVSIVPVLGCATNLKFLKKIINEHKVVYIFHAAAYKHVPLLEENPLQGLYNNVFSTKYICQIAEESSSIKKFIFISSDKAVRPTNIMGASKRLSELIVQAYAERSKTIKNNITCFSMVRFGNVLESSGSVVPLFKKQIRLGGPVTVTHPNVTRYFMTITEAAQLVLQASSLAEGGDLFLLDMGQPVKIIDLAEKMISLQALTIKDKENYNGDIEIKFIGLRPGEKLYEELLIDSESKSTKHPLIFKANEKFISSELLFPQLELLKKFLKDNQNENSLKLLKVLVKEWKGS